MKGSSSTWIYIVFKNTVSTYARVITLHDRERIEKGLVYSSACIYEARRRWVIQWGECVFIVCSWWQPLLGDYSCPRQGCLCWPLVGWALAPIQPPNQTAPPALYSRRSALTIAEGLLRCARVNRMYVCVHTYCVCAVCGTRRRKTLNL